MKIEQRAFLVYVLINFAFGLLLFTLMMSPLLGGIHILWYVITVLGVLEVALMLKINYDGYKYGIVEGFKRNVPKRKNKN